MDGILSQALSVMVQTLYVATTNPGKLRDFAAAATSHELSILPLPGLSRIVPPPEDEPTFAANAREKSAYYSRFLPGEIVLADDSGLEVVVLQGAPGVRSARYAEDAGFDPGDPTGAALTLDLRNNLYLLQQLRGVADGHRGARYRCVVAAARNGEILALGEGSVSGSILSAPQGEGGFGYDPLFYLPEIDRTMAEIDLQWKDRLSHRGKALRDLFSQRSFLDRLERA